MKIRDRFVALTTGALALLPGVAAAQSAQRQSDHVSSAWTAIYGGIGLGYANYQSGQRWILSTAAPSGFTLAGRVGYDHQFGSWVLGAFADAQIGSARNVFDDSVGLFRDVYIWKQQRNVSLNSRIGYVFGAVLPYVTAGYTLGRMEALNTFGGFGIARSDGFRVKADGLNIGVGAEYMVASHWSVFAEHRHVFARRKSLGTPYVVVRASTGLSTVGVNYRF